MKIVLAGACGKLGSDILRALIREGHEVTAADVVDRDVEGADRSRYVFRKLDVTDAPSLKGLCDGADAVITTVGLTGVSAQLTNYDIDYRGNLNLLNEAVRAGVRKFVYISVLHADTAPEEVPMCYAKKLMEAELVKSGIPYVIHRPSGYFYDIVKVFRPMIEKGKVTLLGRSRSVPMSSIRRISQTSFWSICPIRMRFITSGEKRPGPMRKSPACALRRPGKNRRSARRRPGSSTCWQIFRRIKRTASSPSSVSRNGR
jgi:uncharacterized protein YbjT (DUF2867 family)